jgi:hypothetical protein
LKPISCGCFADAGKNAKKKQQIVNKARLPILHVELTIFTGIK